MKPLRTLIAIAAAAGSLTAASCGDTVVVHRAYQPATHAWIAGHSEWVGDDCRYVPGHWVVVPATCREVVAPTPTERVVWVERPVTRVVYVDRGPCDDRAVVVQPSCPPPSCEHGSSVSVHVVAPVLPLLLPPLPFLFLHHHH
jgi:hypothetical protein